MISSILQSIKLKNKLAYRYNNYKIYSITPDFVFSKKDFNSDMSNNFNDKFFNIISSIKNCTESKTSTEIFEEEIDNDLLDSDDDLSTESNLCYSTGIPSHVFTEVGNYIYERSLNNKEVVINLNNYIIDNYFDKITNKSK